MSDTLSVLTDKYRNNHARYHAGQIATLPKFAKITVGGGGHTGTEARAPSSTQTSLNAPSSTVKSATVTLNGAVVVSVSAQFRGSEIGNVLSEAGVVDADNNLCAIVNYRPKYLEPNETYTITINIAL